MSVLLIMEAVFKPVLTLLVPMSVPVIMDMYWILMDTIVQVTLLNLISIFHESIIAIIVSFLSVGVTTIENKCNYIVSRY